ncbi:MAG: sodium:solute symporter family protein [Microbacteriaceae bacterium]|nr:sodium:solute symporter family protein [Microbacteriaceae bacterium]
MNGEINVIPLIILIVYMVIVMAIGIWSRSQMKKGTAREYLTGDGKVGFWVNGVAIFAAFATGGTMLGNMGLSYAQGWGYLAAYNAGVTVGYLITTFFLAKTLRNLNVNTVPELLKVRFPSKLLNLLVPLVVMGTLTAYLVAQMKVGGILGERLLGVPYWVSLVVVGVVYIFYTFWGGMKAVTLTDFMQGLIMISVVVVAGFTAMFAMDGGPGEIYEAAQALMPAWTSDEVLPIPAYIGGFLVWATVIAILPHTVMRVFAAKDERTGRASLTLGLGLYVVTGILTTIFVVAGTIVLNDGGQLPDNDAAFLLFLEETLPIWFVGIAYAGIFAAVMSSVSAMLLGLAAAFAYDFVGTIKPDIEEHTQRKIISISVLVFGVLTLLLAFNPPEFLTLLYTAAMGLLASCLFWPAVLGIWWRRANSAGALAGVIGGGFTYLFLLWGPIEQWFGYKMASLEQILYSLPVSLLCVVIGSLVTKPPTSAEVRRVAIAHEREYEEIDAH